jgi:hypothetical protein
MSLITYDFAFDWVGRNLYYINNFFKELQVFNVDNTYKATLIKENITNAYEIEVDPRDE